MKTVIIADDLTGANDTGIQLAKNGMPVVVQLDNDVASLKRYDAVVFDTDSRSVLPEKAYDKVKTLCERIHHYEPQIVYKKIDSTLRGNIGSELDAIDDVWHPDLVVIAPAYPQLGRVMRDGTVYVDGAVLHNTQSANDLMTPITNSHLPSQLQAQTERKIGTITVETIEQGIEAIIEAINERLQLDERYVVFDAESEAHLADIVHSIRVSGLHALWCGSAGLAHALFHRSSSGLSNVLLTEKKQVLVSVGSVSEKTRKQVDLITHEKYAIAIKLQGENLLKAEQRELEIVRVQQLLISAFHTGQNVVLYLSNTKEEIQRTQRLGEQLGLTPGEVGHILLSVLGKITADFVRYEEVQHLILMGGDTARQVCVELGVKELELIDVVEEGSPLIRLIDEQTIYAMTKSGSFGDERILQRMLRYYEGCVKH